MQFQRSTNGGVTWQSPVNIPNGPIYGSLDVDTNGNVFLGGEGNTFYCIRSSNAQIGGQTPSFDQVTAVNMGGDLGSGGINGVGLTGMLFLAIDHSGGATNNNIYMLASVIPPGRSTTDVMFVRSTDGGLTFSAPQKINDDPVNPNKWHWFGTFAVAPNGRLDAVWYDTRNAANNTDSQLFYSFSTDAGVTWSSNVAVSNAFNPFEGYPNQSKIGDYITIVSDDTGGNVAYSATFNFNPNRGQHEEDVYYVRVFSNGRRHADSNTHRSHLRDSYAYRDLPYATTHSYRHATVTPTDADARSEPTPRARPTPAPRLSLRREAVASVCSPQLDAVVPTQGLGFNACYQIMKNTSRQDSRSRLGKAHRGDSGILAFANHRVASALTLQPFNPAIMRYSPPLTAASSFA